MATAPDGPDGHVNLSPKGGSSAFRVDDDARALARGIVVVETTRIPDSCGFVVPRMDLVVQRDQLLR